MRKLALFGLFAGFLFAGEHQYDIVPRVINFLIFAGILYYLIADKVKNFFESRKEEIASKFQEVESKLQESKATKRALEQKLEEAKAQAKEIVETAKVEAEHISNKIRSDVAEEIKIMEKVFEDTKEIEIKKAKKEAVAEFLKSVLKDVTISSDEAAKIILKVA